VREINRYNRREKNLKYYKTLFNIFRFKDSGRPNLIYNVIEIEILSKSKLKRLRFLGRIRLYNPFIINRSAHIILISFKKGNTFYVNNYIN